MDPIATYYDKSHRGLCAYELFSDRIVVRFSSTFGNKSESALRLQDLDPEFATAQVRTNIFATGLWLMTVPWLVYWALVELTQLDPFGTFPGFFLAMGFAGLVTTVIGLRRERFVQFQTVAGVPALNIFREGPKRSEFDEFVSTLVRLIRTSKATP